MGPHRATSEFGPHGITCDYHTGLSEMEVATNTGKNSRRISTFHSIGGALCLSLCRSFL